MANDPLSVLHDVGFGHNSPSDVVTKPKLAAPSVATMVKVKIENIQAYDKNPRKAANEKYDDIKESIRAIGLQQQISITMKPNADHYIVRSGGNTRLKILKELYFETNDPKFQTIDCSFVPFTNDLELLSLHMLENEQRGRMLFIDIALAIKDFKLMFDATTNKSTSYRVLAEEMKKQGWSIHHGDISSYFYAITISDSLPYAFANGLGRKKVKDIKQIETRMEKWTKETNQDFDKALQYFKHVLFENDAAALDLSIIETALIKRLAEKFSITINIIRNAFIMIKEDGSLLHDYEDNRVNNPVNNHLEQEIILNKKIDQDTLDQAKHEPNNNASSTADNHSSPIASYIAPVVEIPSSPEPIIHNITEAELATRRARRDLLDHFNFILGKVKAFDEAFVVTDDAFILCPKNVDQLLSSSGKTTQFYKEDEKAIWWALFFRLEIMRIRIEFKDAPHKGRDQLLSFSSSEHLNNKLYLPFMVSYNFFYTNIALLSNSLLHNFCPAIQPEIIEIFRNLPALDQKIQSYLSLID